jgi:hypothetical protein
MADPLTMILLHARQLASSMAVVGHGWNLRTLPGARLRFGAFLVEMICPAICETFDLLYSQGPFTMALRISLRSPPSQDLSSFGNHRGASCILHPWWCPRQVVVPDIFWRVLYTFFYGTEEDSRGSDRRQP